MENRSRPLWQGNIPSAAGKVRCAFIPREEMIVQPDQLHGFAPDLQVIHGKFTDRVIQFDTMLIVGFEINPSSSQLSLNV